MAAKRCQECFNQEQFCVCPEKPLYVPVRFVDPGPDASVRFIGEVDAPLLRDADKITKLRAMMRHPSQRLGFPPGYDPVEEADKILHEL